MPVHFQCGNCNANYSVDDKLAGKRAKCKKCQQMMQIPRSGSAATQVTAELVEEPKSKTASAPVKAEVVATAEPSAASVSATRPRVADAPTSVLKVELSKDDLLNAIARPIEPVPTTLSYRIAATGVAFLMVLLPLIYVAIIVMAIVGVWWYALHGTAIFQSSGSSSGRGGFALLLLYVGPLVVGVMTVLFMIKPLFARAAKSEGKRSLKRSDEPKLFAFVDKLCESVHAPKPKRIDVDCDVNASASFRRGMLSMFMSGDLVLTIGMPLAAGLTARQLGGVLAHEFGHFSQGFGMRVSYIVRSVSHWFSRVVYERDQWDEWLANTANSIDLRIGIVLHLARILIWLTRRILWALMMLGHIFSCYLLRQMEYDADLHEIRFAGSDDFRKTSMQLRRLGVAYQQSMADQQTFFMDGKLGNDLPKLTQFNRDAQDDALIEKIFEGIMDEKTEWLTTHPVDRDRVAKAKEENDPGVFQLEAPASALFDKFEETCENVTRDMFKQIFGDELKPKMLVPVEHLVAHKAAAQEARIAMRRMFGGHFGVPRQMSLPMAFSPPDSPQESITALREARQVMIDTLPGYTKISEQFDQADSHWLMCHQVDGLLDMGVQLKQQDFQVPVQSKAAALKAADEYRQKLANMNDDLRPLESAFEKRVRSAGELLQTADLQTQLGEEANELFQQLQIVCQTLPQVQAAYADLVPIRNQFASVGLMLRVAGGQEVTQEAINKIMTKVHGLAAGLNGFHDRFKSTFFPFEHADGQITLTQYLVSKVPPNDDLGQVVGAAEKLLDNYFYVYFRSIGTLAKICQRVEETLAMPAQADPPEETAPSDEGGERIG